jgi:hypothetical protein
MEQKKLRQRKRTELPGPTKPVRADRQSNISASTPEVEMGNSRIAIGRNTTGKKGLEHRYLPQ